MRGKGYYNEGREESNNKKGERKEGVIKGKKKEEEESDWKGRREEIGLTKGEERK